MKKVLIVFVLIFILTLVCPMFSSFAPKKDSSKQEETSGKNPLVTIFDSKNSSVANGIIIDFID